VAKNDDSEEKYDRPDRADTEPTMTSAQLIEQLPKISANRLINSHWQEAVSNSDLRTQRYRHGRGRKKTTALSQGRNCVCVWLYLSL